MEIPPEDQPFPKKLNATLASRLGHGAQQKVADQLGLTRASVNDWCRGRSQPAPETVFALEDALGVDPGYLSRELGYLPLAFDHPPEAKTYGPDCWKGDPRLSDAAREMLRVVYDQLVAPRPRKRSK